MNEYKSFYKTVGGNEGGHCHYPTRLDPYGKGCQHDCEYCISVNTMILMYDGSLKRVGDVNVGDEIYGIVDGEPYRSFTKSIVTNKSYHTDKAYKITLKNGNELICSGNHQWLSNRGWKFTKGAMSGPDQRPYLTENNTLMGFSTLFNIGEYQETDEYKRGYLRGVILGDANLKEYTRIRRGREHEETSHNFRLALKNENITFRAKQYLDGFGVRVGTIDFPMIDRASKEKYMVVAICSGSKESFDKINELIKKENTREFKRGYLAGIYDAEGSNNILIRRIYNSDDEIIQDTIDALKEFSFEYTFDKDYNTKNKVLKTVRLIGGVTESIRFNVVTNCIVANGCGRIENLRLKSHKSDGLQIVSIEEYADSMELVDITTTTRNFIANGVVSHNCYAKSLLDFRGLWDAPNPSVADFEKVRKKVASLPDGMPAIRIGGMTDPFQPLEKTVRGTYNLIDALNKKRQPYLIVTKGAIVADDEYIELMDKSLAHIQVTITCFNDDKYRELDYEKASLPSDRIKAVEKLQENGFDVQVRLSTFIPEFVDFDVLNSIKCDKILVEFLRINTWIKKWFDIDYSEYIVKHGGYLHLPLELKKDYIKKITGFKEITVCEDEDLAYDYWTNNFNPNKDDCCNLRL